MSALHMFLPASEPARSEALALFVKTHHLPRHLVRGILPRNRSEPGPAIATGALQVQQQVLSQELQTPAAPE
jgi:hypothetical protein